MIKQVINTLLLVVGVYSIVVGMSENVTVNESILYILRMLGGIMLCAFGLIVTQPKK